MVEGKQRFESRIAPVGLSHNSSGQQLAARGLVEFRDQRLDFMLLQSLAGKAVLSARLFDASLVVALCKFAGLLEMTEIASHHPLDGKLVITAFFEASTRTRLSFESAALRLDAKVVSVPDGKVTGIAKGESLADIGEMFNTYGDLVVMRHPKSEAVSQLQTHLRLPLINAGNGTDEHPTQALVDWYTLLKWRPELCASELPRSKRIRLGIIGDPSTMRTVRSFLYLACCFAPAISELYIISPNKSEPTGALKRSLSSAGIPLTTTDKLGPILPSLDVVYINSIALLDDGYHELSGDYNLSASSRLKKGAVILHPFARRGELAEDLDGTEHNLYFAQAAGAVYLRQALLICLLERLTALPGGVLYLAK